MVKWNVYLNGHWIDAVFFTISTTREEVYISLVNHDFYDDRIMVRLAK